ncbi:MAG: hypothetical protein KDK39_03000 [Leptospiraceae bacterium]|nr:hypothetical protein [Leptospiraceae bacterium]
MNSAARLNDLKTRLPLLKKIYEIIYCTVAFVALACAFFDATYLVEIPYLHKSFRDVYLESFPRSWRQPVSPADVAEDPDLQGKEYDERLLFYDPIKGIKLHRTTRDYLKDVSALSTLLQDPGSTRKEVMTVLDRLQQQSVTIVDQNPFKLANKSGELERIKNRMREFTGNESSKGAFAEFWSNQEVQGYTLPERITWFDLHIAPLMQRNYFRWIGEDGQPENHYAAFDRWFVFFFMFDFFARWILSIRGGELRKWYLFPVRNWSEIFNLYPPAHSGVWRLMRVIPFLLRMRQNNFLPSSGLAPAIIHDNAAVIAEEISGMVLINILGNARSMIESKGLGQLSKAGPSDMMDHINGLLNQQAAMISQKVVPGLKDEISALVRHSISTAMQSYLHSPLGPGVKLILNNAFEQVDAGLEAAIAGPEGVAKMTAIMQAFIAALMEAIGDADNIAQMESHIIQILDSVINDLREQQQSRT